jgi:hypothetical protein
MAKAKIKKMTLIVLRPDIEKVLGELIPLGCVEISEPLDPDMPSEPAAAIAPVMIELDGLNANLDSIAVLGTEYTLILSGWIASRSEPELLSKLAGYLCAWEIEAPTPDEYKNAPLIIKCPKFFGGLRSRGHKPFCPLKTAAGATGERTADI